MEARLFTRVATHHPATVVAPDGTAHRGTLRDVALNGVFIAGVALPVGTAVDLSIPLADDAGIAGRGHVARTTPDGIGIALDLVEGTESCEHLRKLVLYNTRTLEQTSKVVGEISRVSGLRAIDPNAPPPA